MHSLFAMCLRNSSPRCLPFLLVFGVLILAQTATFAPARASECGLAVSCSVEDLGSDRFRITYDLTNISGKSDAMFKWRLESPMIAPEWVSVGFNPPPGWSGDHDSGQLDFMAPNGSGNTQRLYSNTLAHCGGPNSLTFQWTFDRNGGPLPDCSGLDGDDFKVHVQMINPNDCANVGNSFLCPYVLPTLGLTWGNLKAFYHR